MPALDGTIAFKEMYTVAMGIGEHLDFHMPRLLEVLFQQDPVITKRGRGFALGALQRGVEFIRAAYHTHPLAATTGAGLDEQWIAN